MPNCPICGKEVQPTTAFCPSCGTDLRQVSAGPTIPTGSYPPAYSYPQQGTMIPAGSQPHSHRKYILTIIAVGIIALLVGGLIGYSFPIPPDVTLLTGTVTVSSQYHGNPNQIIFNGATTGNVSSGISSNGSYGIYLPIGDSYSVTVQWLNMTSGPYFGTHTCSASPSTFSSSNANATQNFSC